MKKYQIFPGVGRVLASSSKYGEKVKVVNGDKNYDYYKFELEVRDADAIKFTDTQTVFNGENYRGYLVIKNHIQSDKNSNVVSTSTLSTLLNVQYWINCWDENEMMFKENLKKKNFFFCFSSERISPHAVTAY